MTKSQKIDLAVVIGIICVSIPPILWFDVKPLISTIFFLVIPSLFLIIRKPKQLKRIFVGSFLIGGVFSFIVDFIAVINNAWSQPSDQYIFAYKILNIIPIDEVIWFFSWALIIIVFYEHFLEREHSDNISPNFKYGIGTGLTVLTLILGLSLLFPEMIEVKYAYLLLGSITLLPILFWAVKKPTMLIKFLKVAPFFFFLFLIFELTALHLNQWYFPGFYIGYIEILTLRFPIEEFFFFILLSSTIALSFYEIYVDDRR